VARGKPRYGAYSNRKRPRRAGAARAPFRAWGVALAFMVLLLAAVGAWTGAVFVAAVLVFYLLAIRLTRCRVQTRQGTPCQWLVRGVVGTCDWHRGLKRGFPHLMQVPRTVLPRFMWLRPDPAVVAAPTMEPQPAAGATTVDATTPDAARPGYDWVIMGLEVVSACVAVLSLVQQVLSS